MLLLLQRVEAAIVGVSGTHGLALETAWAYKSLADRHGQPGTRYQR
jgi:hypothetical protein